MTDERHIKWKSNALVAASTQANRDNTPVRVFRWADGRFGLTTEDTAPGGCAFLVCVHPMAPEAAK